MDDTPILEDQNKKKKGRWKYPLYIIIVLVATAVSLTISLWGDNFKTTVNAFQGADWKVLAIILGIVATSYLLEGLIILIFCRLYTRKYRYTQGVASSLIGQFYSDVTPGASGGQIMQAYTLKRQGVQVSNAASIMVMWFILYQTALIGFDIVALIVKWNQISSIGNVDVQLFGGSFTLPMWPLIIIGFIVNLSVIAVLLLMSNSHHFHNFMLHYVVGFLGKIKIIRNPDKTRESLRVQVENFRIELRRLSANIPVVLVQILLFLLIIILRSSVPYWAGLSLRAWSSFDFQKMMDASFTSSFHQMITGLMPLPGSAGVSELFYNLLFNNYFPSVGGNSIVTATQIIWRTSTFHLVMLITGFFSAFYKSRPAEDIRNVTRATFVTLQYETYAERKKSAETMYETSQLNRFELKKRFFKKKENKLTKVKTKPQIEVIKEEKQTPKKQKKVKTKSFDWERMDI